MSSTNNQKISTTERVIKSKISSLSFQIIITNTFSLCCFVRAPSLFFTSNFFQVLNASHNLLVKELILQIQSLPIIFQVLTFHIQIGYFSFSWWRKLSLGLLVFSLILFEWRRKWTHTEQKGEWKEGFRLINPVGDRARGGVFCLCMKKCKWRRWPTLARGIGRNNNIKKKN